MNHSRLLIFCLILIPLLLPAQKMISLGNLWNIHEDPGFSAGSGTNYLNFFKDSLEINGQYYFQLYSSLDSNLNKIKFIPIY